MKTNIKVILVSLMAIFALGGLTACNGSDESSAPTTTTPTQATESSLPDSSEETTTPESSSEPETEPSEPSVDSEPEADIPDDSSEPDTEIIAPDASDAGNSVAQSALAQVGIPFVTGGATPEDGFDASGLTYYLATQRGISIPRGTAEQTALKDVTKIAFADLEAGDFVYFSAEPNEDATFCGVYVGDGQMVYASVPGDTVKEKNITTSWWTQRFVTGIRLF